jgi:hypothetical protein
MAPAAAPIPAPLRARSPVLLPQAEMLPARSSAAKTLVRLRFITTSLQMVWTFSVAPLQLRPTLFKRETVQAVPSLLRGQYPHNQAGFGSCGA